MYMSKCMCVFMFLYNCLYMRMCAVFQGNIALHLRHLIQQ